MPSNTEEPQPQPPSPWKIKRQFWLRHGLTVSWGVIYPGEIWEVEAFGRIHCRSNGRRVQLTDERKKELLDSGELVWADENKIQISAGLRALITQAPTASTVRACVRSEVGALPAKEETPKTTEDWLKFIESVPAKPPTPSSADEALLTAAARVQAMRWAIPREPNIAAPPPGPAGQNGEYSVRVTARRRSMGTCRFSINEQFDGRVPVPREIIARAAATADYTPIINHITDQLNNGEFEDSFQTYDDYEYYDYETQDTGGVSIPNHNISTVVRAYNEGAAPVIRDDPDPTGPIYPVIETQNVIMRNTDGTAYRVTYTTDNT